MSTSNSIQKLTLQDYLQQIKETNSIDVSQLSNLELQQIVYQLRIEGSSYSELSRLTNLTENKCKKIFDKALNENQKDRLFDCLDLQLARIDFLFKEALKDIKTNRMGTLDRCIKLLERQSKLLGLENLSQNKLSNQMQEHLMLMNSNDSALDKYRNSQAELAQLKLDKEKNKLIEKHEVEKSMQQIGIALNQSCEKLDKLFGSNAGDIVRQIILSLENTEITNDDIEEVDIEIEDNK